MTLAIGTNAALQLADIVFQYNLEAVQSISEGVLENLAEFDPANLPNGVPEEVVKFLVTLSALGKRNDEVGQQIRDALKQGTEAHFLAPHMKMHQDRVGQQIVKDLGIIMTAHKTATNEQDAVLMRGAREALQVVEKALDNRGILDADLRKACDRGIMAMLEKEAFYSILGTAGK
jgi:hypothetical protein